MGTVTQAKLRRLVIARLREKYCADVAEVLGTNSPDTAVGILRKRCKTIREKKKREDERKRAAEIQAISKGEMQNGVWLSHN